MESESPVSINAMKARKVVSAEESTESRVEQPSSVVRVHLGRKLRLNRSAVTVNAIAAGFIGLAALYLVSVAPDLKHLSSSVWASLDHSEGAPRAGLPSPVMPRDALAEFPASFRAELMSPTLRAKTEMSRSLDYPVDQICDYLGSSGLGKFATMHNPIAEGQWVCTSDILPSVRHAASSDVSSVFMWMRGADRKELDLIRLKINLTDPESSDEAKSLALNLLERLHDKFKWDMPEALVWAIRNVHEAGFVRYGISYQVIREWSSLPRLNVVIHAVDASGILPTDSFSIDKPQNLSPARPAAAVRFKPSLPSSPIKPPGPDPAPIEDLMR